MMCEKKFEKSVQSYTSHFMIKWNLFYKIEA